MLVQIRNINQDGTKGDVLFLQSVKDSNAIFSKLVEQANNLKVGTKLELAVQNNGRTFVFLTDEIDVKEIVLAVNGVKTRKPAKLDEATPVAAAPATTEA